MIPNEKYGFVAKVGDLQSIVTELKKAITMSEDKLTEMAKREKRYVSEHFSIKNQLDSIEAVYKQLVN